MDPVIDDTIIYDVNNSIDVNIEVAVGDVLPWFLQVDHADDDNIFVVEATWSSEVSVETYIVILRGVHILVEWIIM